MEIKNDQVVKIISTLNKNGHKALIVGGAVRDYLQGIQPSDFDILTNASIDQTAAIFKSEKVKIVGQKFKISLVNNVEVSSPRFKGGSTLFPKKDLEMRDFTINSMAYDSENKTIVDHFSSKKDLKNKIVRFTKSPDKRIKEDPLRIIRACRIASLINGTIEPFSKQAMKKYHLLIKDKISHERIRVEILKAMEHDKPSQFFILLHETDVLQHIFPCLEKCFFLDGGPFHGETVFEHCMMTGDAMSSQYPLLRLAGFLHDAGKLEAAREKDGRLSFRGHEKLTHKIKADLEKLRFSNKEIEYILNITHVHMRPLEGATTPKAVRKLISYFIRNNINYRDFLRLRIADRKANCIKKPYTLAEIKLRLGRILQELEPKKNQAFTIADLKISGKDIMELINIEPSPKIGEVLNSLFEKILNEPELNNKESLKKLVISMEGK